MHSVERVACQDQTAVDDFVDERQRYTPLLKDAPLVDQHRLLFENFAENLAAHLATEFSIMELLHYLRTLLHLQLAWLPLIGLRSVFTADFLRHNSQWFN